MSNKFAIYSGSTTDSIPHKFYWKNQEYKHFICYAKNLEEANKIFLTIDGCYFDPNCHFDCSCCGSRWDSAHWETLTISQVRESIKQAQGSTTLWMNEDIPTAYIQHKNEPCEIIG